MAAALDWIEVKKRGASHSREELRAIVDAIASEEAPDYQLAAWLMAVWFRGLDAEEMLWLTEAMRDSGSVLVHPDSIEPTADKHSTGGVGDKTSLVVAPLAAEIGLHVPMISGRGLGHTGGTLDKLQAIEGYRVDLPVAEFRQVLREVGCSIIGQTVELAPADRRLYALRDVTGTVDCVGLIVSSILSKKLAAGPRSLVIDLKCGSGAFMRDLGAAQALARSLIDTARAAGLNASALVTDMNQPLGEGIGHALEVREALDCLDGSGPPSLRELSIELAAEMGRLAGLGGLAELRGRCALSLDDGSASRRFDRMVEAQGGVSGFRDRLRIAPVAEPVRAPRRGFVRSIKTDEIGRAVVDLGGGRLTHADPIDLEVGLRALVRIGDAVEKGQPLFDVHCDDEPRCERARQRIQAAIEVSDEPVPANPLILERVEP
jgi:pyrimidine-nucleoside phosphorylase